MRFLTKNWLFKMSEMYIAVKIPVFKVFNIILTRSVKLFVPFFEK